MLESWHSQLLTGVTRVSHSLHVNPTIRVSVRELHARTGHYVRRAAARQRVIVTNHGEPIAELKPFSPTNVVPFFATRRLRPDFKKAADAGKLRPRPGDEDITELISEDRS